MMKNYFLAAILLVASLFQVNYAFAQCATSPTLPNVETFEATSNCSATCTAACTLSGFWQNVAGDDGDWTADASGTGSTSTGPSSAHGGTQYVYTEASSCFNKLKIIESPCYDFSTAANPAIEFWYHMYGQSMGTLHLDYRTVAGGVWIEDVISPITDNQNLWQKKDVLLSVLAGEPYAQLRFRGITGSNYYSDMALDDITVYDFGPINENVFPTGFQSLAAICDLGSAETLTAEFGNSGTNTIPSGTSIPVKLYFNGAVTNNTMTLTSDWNQGQTRTHTFSGTYNFAPGGTYDLGIEILLPGDDVPNDDLFQMTLEKNAISALPHFTDFDNESNCTANCTTSCVINGFWQNTSADASEWIVDNYGTSSSSTGPSSDHTQNSAAGRYVYLENHNVTICSGTNSSLVSGCIDLASTTQPFLDYWCHLYGAGMGTLQVDISLDNQQTWLTIDGPFTDNLDAWQNRTVDLSPYINSGNIFLRFQGFIGYQTSDMAIDDILLVDRGAPDLELSSIVKPSNGCGLDNATVEIEIKNKSATSLPSGTTIPVSYSVDGVVTNETITLSADLAGGATLNYVFNTNASITPGAHSFSASVSYGPDTDASNDSQTINVTNEPTFSIPHNEDFDQFGNCSTSCTSTCNITGTIWFNSDDADFDWSIYSNTTPTTNTGPTGDHTSGDGKYIYAEQSSSCYNETAILESYCLDMSNASSPTIKFWYHMYGLQMGTMHFDVKIGDGQWQNDFVAPWTSNVDLWQEKEIDLSTVAANEARVKLRIRGVTMGTGVQGDMAIDDISVFDQGDYDLEVNSIVSPSSGCGQSASESVSINFTNNGPLAIPAGEDIVMSFSIDGQVSTETFTTNNILFPGIPQNYTFSNTADFSQAGIYDFKVAASYSLDVNQLNDTIFEEFRSLTVSSFPYVENFDKEDNCFTTSCSDDNPCDYRSLWANVHDGTSDTADWYCKNGSTSTTLTGPTSDHTTGGGKYLYLEATTGCYNTSAFLESPCFDFTNVGTPLISFWYHMYGSNMGTMHFDVSTNGGTTWQRDFIPPWTDNLNQWQNQLITLTGLAGEANVKLRIRGKIGTSTRSDMAIDDIEVVDLGHEDLSISEILKPNSGCDNGATEEIEIEIVHNGDQDILAGTQIPVSFTFQGNTVTETITLASDFVAGTTLVYQFTATVDLSLSGTYQIDASVDHANDTYAANNTKSKTVETLPKAAVGTVEDFESQGSCSTSCTAACPLNGAWFNADDDQYDWRTDKAGTGSSSTGPSVDHTLGNSSGQYVYLEASSPCFGTDGAAHLESRCLDLTGVSSPKLSFWYHMYGSTMGTMHVDVDKGSGWELDFIPPFTDNIDQWQEKSVNLSSLVGNPSVRIRIRGVVGSDYFSDMALDDITILDAGNSNVYIQEVLDPITGCDNTDGNPVTVRIYQDGSNPIPAGDTLFMSYEFNGNLTEDTLILTAPFDPGTTLDYTYSTTISIGTYGNYTIDATVRYTPDIFFIDDTYTHNFTGEGVSVFPHLVTFGNQSNCSTTCSASCELNSEWTNVPNGAGDDLDFRRYKNAAFPTTTGPTGDHTTGSETYIYMGVSSAATCSLKTAQLVSPCYNFTNVINPKLIFWYHMWGTTMGQLEIQVQANGGLWQSVDGPFTDNQDLWQRREVDLSGYIGVSQLRIRFVGSGGLNTESDIALDDIEVADLGEEDLAIELLTKPDDNCGQSNALDIDVEVKHNGVQDIPAGTNIPVTLEFDGSVYTETITTTAPFQPGQIIAHTFSQQLDLSGFGTHTYSVKVKHVNDVYNANDSIAHTVVNQLLTSFPLIEDFDDENTCTVYSCTSVCPLTNSFWQQDESDYLTWRVDAGGTPTLNTGPPADHTTGAGNYLYLESYTSACYGEQGGIISTCMDLSGTQNPQIKFWYHMFGTTMGTLHFDYSDNDGLTWNNDFIPSWTDNKNQWQEQVIDLSPLKTAGNQVRLRIRGTLGTSTSSDIGIDDIIIEDKGPNDIIAKNIVYPIDAGCNYTANENVIFKFWNDGNNLPAGTQIPVSYDLNGNVVNETHTTVAPFNNGDTITYTFTTGADLSANGNYTLSARADYPADVNVPNNQTPEVSFDLNNFSGTTLPYFVNFDNQINCATSCASACNITNGWTNVDYDDMDWMVRSGTTTSSATGPSGDHTTGNGKYIYTETSSCNNKEASLESPCIDLNGVNNPSFKFWYHMYGSSMGMLHVDIKVNNDPWTLDVIPPFTDNVNEWKQASVSLGAYNTDVIKIRLRTITGSSYTSDMALDDFEIVEIEDNDLVMNNVLEPFGGCNVQEYQNVKVEVFNNGGKALPAGTLVPFTLVFDGSTINEIYTLPSKLNPNETFFYTFNNPIHIPTVGTYTFDVSVNLPIEDNTYNDTLTHEFMNQTVNQYPYFYDFELETGCVTNCGTNCDMKGGWTNVYNDQKDWIAHKGSTPTNGTGPTSDHTTGSGYYAYFEADACTGQNAFLQGPCLNFTNVEEPSLIFWYHMKGSQMGTMHLDVKIGGGFWIFDYVPSWDNTGNDWQQKRIDVPGLAGFGNVRFRFRATGGNGTLSDMAIDDITVFDCKRPKIESNRVDYTICEDQDIELELKPRNAQAVRWYKNGVLLTGVTSETLLLTASDTGDYHVEADYQYGCSKTSDTITVKVDLYPGEAALSHDGKVRFCSDDFRWFHLLNEFENYQWYKNGNPISGANNDSLRVNSPGIYHVAVWTNPACQDESEQIVVDWYPEPDKPVISNTVSQTCFGDSIVLSVPLGYGNYQWTKDGTIILGADENEFVAKTSGSYYVLVATANGCDTVSDTVVLDFTFEESPSIAVTGPTTFCEGDHVRLEGSTAEGIRWHRNGQFIPVVTTKDYVAVESGTYTAVFEKDGCFDTSNAVLVNVQPRPTKPDISPKDTSSCDGSNMLLSSANASGNLQWFKDGSAIPNANSNSYVATSTGSYVLVYTDGNGCTNSDTSFFTKFGTGSINITPGDTLKCSGKAVQYCSSVPNGNQWFKDGVAINGATAQCIWVNQPGAYVVTVTQDTCTGSSDTVHVTEIFGQSQPTITQNGPSTFCPNDSVVLTSSNAVAYQWLKDGVAISGADDKNFTATLPGGYNVVATNQFGCSDTSGLLTLNHLNGPILTGATVTENSCPGKTEGSIDAIVNGGEAPVEFNLDNGPWQSSSLFTGLAGGDYVLNVRDINGCTDSLTVRVEDLPSTLDLSQFSIDATCFSSNDGRIILDGIDGQPAYAYSIDGITYHSDGEFNNLTPAAYVPRVRDNLGCEYVGDTIFITEPDPIQATISIDQPISCAGETDAVIEAQAIGGTGGFIYSIDGGANWQGSNFFTNLEPGTYQVIARDISDCEMLSNVIEIESPDTLAFNFVQVVNHVDCFGEQTGLIMASGQGGRTPYEYSIDGINYSSSSVIASLFAGDYVVYLRDESGCVTISDTLTVTEGPELSITASVVKHIDCFGYETGEIQVSASGGTGPLEYSIDLVNYQTSGSFTDLPAGLYDNVTVKDSLGCVIFATPLTITQPNLFEVQALTVQDISCNGAQDGLIELSITGGAGANLISIDGGTTFTTDTIFSGLAAGSYQFIVKDSAGCEVSLPDSIVIEEPELLVLDSVNVNHVACNGGSDGFLEVYMLGGTPPYNFSLDSGLTYIQNPIVAGLSAGTYPLWIKDSRGCQIVGGQYTITEPSQLVATASQVSASCFGFSDGEIHVNASGGSGGYLYSIDNGLSFQGVPSFTGLSAGIYDVIIADARDCQQIVTIQVLEPAELLLNLVQVTGITCFGANDGIITLTASGGTGIRRFSIDGGLSLQTNGVFTNLGPNVYDLVVTDANGCVTAVQQITLTEPDSLQGGLVVLQNLDCANSPDGSLKAQILGGTAPFSYSLNGAPAVSDSVFNNLSSGNYAVTVTDANGCVLGTDSVTLTAPAAINVSSQILQHVSCYNAQDGAVQLFATGGAGNFTYSSDGTTFGPGSVFTNLPAGNHFFYVKDANGCVQQVGPIEILNGNQLFLNASVTSELDCFGDADAIISAVGSGGSGTKTFNIDGGPWLPTGSFQNLAGGTYVIGMKDNLDCEVYDTIAVAEPDLLEGFIDQIIQPGPNDSNGVIRTDWIGGTMPYSYVWSNGGTTEDIFNLPPGSYTLTVTDANGCSSDTTIMLYGLGIEDEKNARLNVYPNPARGLVNLDISGWNKEANIRVLNEVGQEVELELQGSYTNGEYTLDISSLPSGRYFITLENKDLRMDATLIVVD